MKRNILKIMTLCSVAVLALASCKKDNQPQNNAPENGFLATIEANQGNGGRTHLVGTEVQWNAGDQIVVRNTNGTSATFSLSAGENTMNGTFLSSQSGDEFFQPSYTAIYPAADGNSITGEGTATITLPATQSYVANSFANGAMPMMAVSGEQTLEFKNALGGICFPMTGSQTVTRLVLTSNSADDNLSGVFAADYNNGEPTLTCTTGNGNSITLDCGEGVALDATTATDFIIMVPAGSLASGFTLQAYNGSTKVFEKSNNNNFGADFIPRSVIKKVNSNLEVGEDVVAPAGAIAGAYSVSATQQVWFSQGNLQYQASTSTWRFAENQWDYVGNAGGNTAPSASQTSWIDLFGWGTSGYHNDADTYNTNYYPYSTSESIVNTTYNHYGYGPSTNMTDPNLVGTSANYDWGIYNNIIAGETEIAAGTYRTLTNAEWGYLFNTRKVTVGGVQKVPYGEGVVNGVNGVILLPDNWDGSVCSGFTYGMSSWSNSFSESTTPKWSDMEAAGCVFLPAAGYRFLTSLGMEGSYGFYWSSTYNNSYFAFILHFRSGWVDPHGAYRDYGFSVRLACPAE